MSVARLALVFSIIVALVSAAPAARAQATTSTSTAATAPAAQAEAPRADSDSGGPPTTAVVAFVIAGAAFAVGTGILVYGAFKTADEQEQSENDFSTTIDPGVSGSRGFTGETAGSGTGSAEEPSSKAPYDIGAALLGAGAVALTVGLVLAYTHEPGAPGSKSSAKLRVRPTKNGVRVAF